MKSLALHRNWIKNRIKLSVEPGSSPFIFPFLADKREKGRNNLKKVSTSGALIGALGWSPRSPCMLILTCTELCTVFM